MFVCGICKHKKPRRDGVFFHTCSDWWYARLFICNECLENVPMQQSLHELCYECGKHLSLGELTDLSKTRLAFLRAAIEDFEKSHADVLKQTPASTDRECMHPGSMHPNIEKWREKFMP
jgi:hypothetical protein